MRSQILLILIGLGLWSCEDSGLPLNVRTSAFQNVQNGDVTLQSAHRISFLKASDSYQERVLFVADGTGEAVYAIDIRNQDPDDASAFPYDDYVGIVDIRAGIATAIGGGATAAQVTIQSIIKNPYSNSLFVAMTRMGVEQVFILNKDGSANLLDTTAVPYVKINIEVADGTELNMTTHESIATTEAMFALTANEAGFATSRIAAQQAPFTHDSYANLTTANVCETTTWGNCDGAGVGYTTVTPMETLVLYQSETVGGPALMGATTCNPFQAIPIRGLTSAEATAEVYFHIALGGGASQALVLLGSGPSAQALGLEGNKVIKIPYAVFEGDGRDSEDSLRDMAFGDVQAPWINRGVEDLNDNVSDIIVIDDTNVLLLTTTNGLVRLTL